jgi:hypothetical protein
MRHADFTSSFIAWRSAGCRQLDCDTRNVHFAAGLAQSGDAAMTLIRVLFGSAAIVGGLLAVSGQASAQLQQAGTFKCSSWHLI